MEITSVKNFQSYCQQRIHDNKTRQKEQDIPQHTQHKLLTPARYDSNYCEERWLNDKKKKKK